MASQGEVVLVAVPFSDLSGTRRRPVIILSNDRYNRAMADMIVVSLTTRPRRDPFSFEISSSDLESGSLNRPGWVRVDKVYSLLQASIQATFAKVNAATLDRIRTMLADLTGP